MLQDTRPQALIQFQTFENRGLFRKRRGRFLKTHMAEAIRDLASHTQQNEDAFDFSDGSMIIFERAPFVGRVVRISVYDALCQEVARVRAE